MAQKIFIVPLATVKNLCPTSLSKSTLTQSTPHHCRNARGIDAGVKDQFVGHQFLYLAFLIMLL